MGIESPGVPRRVDEVHPPTEDEIASLDGSLAVLGLVYAAYATLGQDASGRPTWQEQIAFLDEHGVVDAGERRTWQSLWQVIAQEQAFHRSLKMEN